MIEQISWDASLVKKFSSSNHYKMLNQLRSEVKKYPLTRKKNVISNPSNLNKLVRKNNQPSAVTQDLSLSSNNSINTDINSNKSTISFNNSKNFSIYNNTSKVHKEENTVDENRSIEELNSSNFKDRLNQVDMK